MKNIMLRELDLVEKIGIKYTCHEWYWINIIWSLNGNNFISKVSINSESKYL